MVNAKLHLVWGHFQHGNPAMPFLKINVMRNQQKRRGEKISQPSKTHSFFFFLSSSFVFVIYLLCRWLWVIKTKEEERKKKKEGVLEGTLRKKFIQQNFFCYPDKIFCCPNKTFCLTNKICLI